MAAIYEDINVTKARALIRDAWNLLEKFKISSDYDNLSDEGKRSINYAIQCVENAHLSDWHMKTF